MITRPLLCAKARELSDLRYPIWCTPKLDGIRALRMPSALVSRAFKPIRNPHLAAAALPIGLDGELMHPSGSFQDTTSAVMSYDGEDGIEYWVFDLFANPSLPYYKRLEELQKLELPAFCRLVLPTEVANEAEFLAFEEATLAAGYEGVIARSALGIYKQGRSTLREHIAVKFKRFEDSEAIILGFQESQTNLNPQVANAFGLMKRPGGKSGKVPTGSLGGFIVRDIHTGVEFECGNGDGLTIALRQQIWNDRHAYIGRVIRYKYQSTGIKDRPRFPSFCGFRAQEDIS